MSGPAAIILEYPEVRIQNILNGLGFNDDILAQFLNDAIVMTHPSTGHMFVMLYGKDYEQPNPVYAANRDIVFHVELARYKRVKYLGRKYKVPTFKIVDVYKPELHEREALIRSLLGEEPRLH